MSNFLHFINGKEKTGFLLIEKQGSEKIKKMSFPLIINQLSRFFICWLVFKRYQLYTTRAKRVINCVNF